MKKISIYKVISVVALLVIIFILTLPQIFNIDAKQNEEECIRNMRILHDAIKRYMEERQEDFIGSTTDLYRTGYTRRSLFTCPEGSPDDRYFVQGDFETGEITVSCPLEDEFPSHKLPESLIQ